MATVRATSQGLASARLVGLGRIAQSNLSARIQVVAAMGLAEMACAIVSLALQDPPAHWQRAVARLHAAVMACVTQSRSYAIANTSLVALHAPPL